MVVVEVLSVSELDATEHCNIREDLVADSLDMISLIWALEEEFGGKIEEDVLEALRTPGDIANYIHLQSSARSEIASSG